MKACLSLIIGMSLFSSLGWADCSAAAGSFLCTSYEFNRPVSILQDSGVGPALTVSGGAVGIGTLTPDELLTVAGVIQSTDGGFKFPDGTLQITASRWVTSGATSYLSSGNVGIGTSTPGYSGFANTLSIHSPVNRGSLELSTGQADGPNVAAARIGFFATTNTAGNGAQISSVLVSTEGAAANDRGGVIQFFTKANGAGSFERMRINSTGSVGIGTTTPATKLDINGTMKLAKNSGAPHTCNATFDGAIALTHVYTMCACNGSSWVKTSDGTTACSW